MRLDLRFVSTVESPTATAYTEASWVVEEGVAGAMPAGPCAARPSVEIQTIPNGAPAIDPGKLPCRRRPVGGEDTRSVR
jgi:hypothetical protein